MISYWDKRQMYPFAINMSNNTFRKTILPSYHIVSSETEFHFKKPTKPGGTFVTDK